MFFLQLFNDPDLSTLEHNDPSTPKKTSFLAIFDFNKPPIDIRLLTIMAVILSTPKPFITFHMFSKINTRYKPFIT